MWETLFCRNERDSYSSCQSLVGHVMLSVEQIDSSTLAFGQLMIPNFQGWRLTPGGSNRLLLLHSVCVGGGPVESGCWVQARNWEESSLRVVGPPEPLQLPVPSCNPSLGSEFLLPSTHPFLSGH